VSAQITLLVATTNQGKLREIAGVLAGAPVRLRWLADLPGVDEPEETGETFAENARQKARHYASRSGLLTVAEDSGLVVDALGGAPGVHSARFPGATYADKFERLFALLDRAGQPESPARFVCALALAEGQRILFESSGVVEGHITRPPRGSEGFGYDPIFFCPPFGRTLAEVAAADKALVSHRGQAFRALRNWIGSNFDC
jgi:XTP/dITP diphosphohydrolase